MDRLNAYKPVLQLDNLLQILSDAERTAVNLFRSGKSQEVPHIVLLLNDWIEENHWQPPEFKYSEERTLFYKENGQWLPIEKHKLYKAEIKVRE